MAIYPKHRQIDMRGNELLIDHVTASQDFVLGDDLTIAGTLSVTGNQVVTATSASTSGSTSVEPIAMSSTMTGAGGVGGRAAFRLSTNVALGSWSNALKGEVTYGASGKTTGLGSAIVAEMTLSAGTVDGNYAPMELELNLGAGASTGTATALVYASVNGAAAGTFDDNGFVLNLQGLTAGGAHVFNSGATITNVNEFTHGLRIKVGADTYYIPLVAAAAFLA